MGRARASAFSLAAARLGWSLPESRRCQLHGRAARADPPALQPGARDPGADLGRRGPAALARAARAARLRRSRLTVLEALGGPRERIRAPGRRLRSRRRRSASTRRHRGRGRRRDARALRSRRARRRAVRARRPAHQARDPRLTLSALAPRRASCSGTSARARAPSRSSGCCAIRAPRDRDRGARRPRRAHRRNAAAARRARRSTSSRARAGGARRLPRPDAVFIGGGATERRARRGRRALPGGRLVVNAVTLETRSACSPPRRARRRAHPHRGRARRAGRRHDRLAPGDAGDAMGGDEAVIVRASAAARRTAIEIEAVLAAIARRRGGRRADRSPRSEPSATSRRSPRPRGARRAAVSSPSRPTASALASRSARVARGARRPLRRGGGRARRRRPGAPPARPAHRARTASPAPSRREGRHDRAFHRRRAGRRRPHHRARPRPDRALPGLPLCRLDRAAGAARALPARRAPRRHRAALARRDRGRVRRGARRGHDVARLHSGDLSIWSAVAEQLAGSNAAASPTP